MFCLLYLFSIKWFYSHEYTIVIVFVIDKLQVNNHYNNAMYITNTRQCSNILSFGITRLRLSQERIENRLSMTLCYLNLQLLINPLSYHGRICEITFLYNFTQRINLQKILVHFIATNKQELF